MVLGVAKLPLKGNASFGIIIKTIYQAGYSAFAPDKDRKPTDAKDCLTTIPAINIAARAGTF